MDIEYRYKAYHQAMEFESIYDYNEHYKVKGNPKVWKFMSIDKFQSLLDTKSLYFSQPTAFLDPLEGSYSQWDIKNNEHDDSRFFPREYMRKIQEFSAISCWHMNPYESAGMWDLYLGGEDGVAIQTDYNSLLSSIRDLRYKIFSGKIQYIDFKQDMTSKNIYDTLFYKRKSFAHEQELRLMIVASRLDGKGVEAYCDRENYSSYESDKLLDELEEASYQFSHPKGTLVPCHLPRLIQRIYISPRSEEDVARDIRKRVAKSDYSGLHVVQSNLYSDYIY